jgi:hypothetical protein
MALKYPSGLEAQIQSASKGRPFKVCPVCGNRQVPQSWQSCYECERLTAMKVAIPKDPRSGVPDNTNPVQSNDAFNHSGYSDTISSGKVSKNKERV